MAKKKTSSQLSQAAAFLGRKGGQAGTGKAKARTSEQARAAVNARWKKAREGKEQPPPPSEEPPSL